MITCMINDLLAIPTVWLNGMDKNNNMVINPLDDIKR